jgi:antitoxin PrlF
MSTSVITRKGQVTIPKDLRDFLGLEEGQKVYFIRRGDEVILKVLRGNILDLKGSVKPSKRPEDFERIRESVKKETSGRIARDG